MANEQAMVTPMEQWKGTHESFTQRFGIGLFLSLALVLVAFEWRTAEVQPRFDAGEPMPMEEGMELPPMSFKPKAASAQLAKRARAPLGPIRVSDEPPPDEGPGDEPDENSGAIGAGLAADTFDLAGANPPEVIDDVMLPWGKGVEQLPHFAECAGQRRLSLEDCTEARIKRHLDRYFRVPEGLSKEEFTVISFEIGIDGSIGRLVCSPRPSRAVEHEVERVVRALPAFVPGSQNGRPVRVIYQLPLRVKRI
ncbi:MAG: hypothetical protein IPM46_02545 [Flavobacteriales bacterium]|nr:hypothetical protein [Flavobacteriales bacterium]